MIRNFLRTICCLFLVSTVWASENPVGTSENLLPDTDFSHVGGAESVWQVTAGKDGTAEPAKGPEGKPSGERLKAATLTQSVRLPEGLFELTVKASGGGELILGVSDCGERSQMLGKDEGTFGYLFHTDAGVRNVTIRISVDGMVTAAAICPATDEQKAGWKREQKSIQQFGFITESAQRPSPGAAPLQFTGNVRPLAAMIKLAVLDEPRLNTSHAAQVARLVQWLGLNGFERVDGEKLPAWIAGRIRRGDAYGSVVVLPRGVSPIALLEGAPGKPLWVEYLRAGGRIVHCGDMPFNTVESPTVQAPGLDLNEVSERGADLLSLGYSWSSPYCGNNGLPVTATRAAKEWGLEHADSPITGVPIENTSLPFHVYTVPATGKQGASDWFRNVRSDMPWSGLIKMWQEFDGNNDAALRDVWRAAHYVGKPVVIPPLPPPVGLNAGSVLRMTLSAGGMEGRHEFVRGENMNVQVVADDSLQATSVRLELLQDDKTLFSETQPATNAAFVVKTAPFADGAYTLRVIALQGDKPVQTDTETLGIRYLPPESFNFEMAYDPGTNPQRTELELADIHDAGMEIHLVNLNAAADLDVIVRNHVGFSFRCNPDMSGIEGREVTIEKNPEYFRFDNNGKPMVAEGYSGGRPSLGLSHPEIRAVVAKTMEREVKVVAGLPSFRPYILCNDDFASWYGWDYAPHVVQAFKNDTGLEAPRRMDLPPKFGAIPDQNPWVQWFEWTLIHVDGAFNKAETEGVLKARPDVRVGPIPGGMEIPLVQMWEPSQYPPYNFGKNGFNLICSYYYNVYWQPIMTDTFWMEIGRMDNRDLPEWNMPDAFMTAGYTRNNLFHYLAGGVRGLAYFDYPTRNTNTWPEFKRLGKIIRRIGPVQTDLQPARRDIGMLNSFTSNCFDPGHTLIQVYGYHNLMQAHFSMEMISEDEILAGRASQYKAVLLYDVKYLRQSVFDALAKFAAGGGLVLLDNSVPFDLPGAKRLAVDVGMGTEKTLAMPPEGAHLSTPGIHDYGHADRIEVIQKAVSAYVKPQFDSSDIHVVATQFEAEGVPYTWFVNAHDGKEYMFCRERMIESGGPGGGTPGKIKEVREWEVTETAKGPYVTTVEYDSAPGVPYDLVSGKKLPLAKTVSGRYALTLSMERFGGVLVAWLPAEISAVKLSAPKTAANQAVRIAATVMANDKPMSGSIPIEFILRDPLGKESIVSGVRATRTGQATFDWTPAINEPTGKWTLQVNELASGKTARQQIDLSK